MWPKPRHYWRKALRAKTSKRLALRFAPVVCDPAGTIAQLSHKPQAALGWLSRLVAFFFTPFKRLGISGWKETGCTASAQGAPVRDAQHSTDGFWTIDLGLTAFVIAGQAAPPGRFIRIEVEPGTKAHDVCAATPVTRGATLNLGGPVVIDADGPFLEIHPDDDFHLVAGRDLTQSKQKRS